MISLSYFSLSHLIITEVSNAGPVPYVLVNQVPLVDNEQVPGELIASIHRTQQPNPCLVSVGHVLARDVGVIPM